MARVPSAAHGRVQFGIGAGAGLAIQGAQIPLIVFVKRGAIGNAHARTPRAYAGWFDVSASDLCVRRAGGPAISSWLGSSSGLGGLVKGRGVIAPRFFALRALLALGVKYAVLDWAVRQCAALPDYARFVRIRQEISCDCIM
ncbi:hypothetical protein D3C72_1844390 [compost metagenome]